MGLEASSVEASSVGEINIGIRNVLMSRRIVRKFVEMLMQKAIDRPDEQVIMTYEEVVLDGLETCNVTYYKVSSKCAWICAPK